MQHEKLLSINLEGLTSSSEEKFKKLNFDLARGYAPYLGLDFDKDILSNLGDKAWWEADYGVKIVDGKEIGMSIKDAFRCLVDPHRTYQLAGGIREEVENMRKTRDCLTGIDAGTGTGILSILMLASGVDKVYAIEINKETYDATSDFIERLGFQGRIIMILGDATQIHLPDLVEQKADILVSENLSAALMDEPQYEIINHLSKYLSYEGKIIPYIAQLSISLAVADWEGVYPGKTKIAERRLIKSERVSNPVFFAGLESQRDMSVPIIQGNTEIPTEYKRPINTLLIHTMFQINEKGKHFFLEPDTAEFLGKTAAFRLENEAYARDGKVVVNLKYGVGRKGELMQVTGNGNKIDLEDPYLEG